MLNEMVIEEDQIANMTRTIIKFLEDMDAEVRFYKKGTDVWGEEYLSKYLMETVEYFSNVFRAQMEDKFNKENLVYFKNLKKLEHREEKILKKLMEGTPVAFTTDKYFIGFYKSSKKYVVGSLNISLEEILFGEGEEYNLWIAVCYDFVNKIIKDGDLKFVIVDYLVGRQTSNVFKMEYKTYLEEGLKFLEKRKKRLTSKKLLQENREKVLIYKTLIERSMQREKISSFSEKIFYNVFIYYKKALKSYISGMFEIKDRYYEEAYDRLLFYKLEKRDKMIHGMLEGIEDEEEKHYRRLLKLKAQEMDKQRDALMERYKISHPSEDDITTLLKKSGFLEER